jgi:guanine deaminase
MDRNCPEYLREDDSEEASLEWLGTFAKHRKDGRYKNTGPILTPRFIPSCSGELMKRLAKIQKEYSLPLQSHISENREEISWVKELCPESENYAGAYDGFGLLEGRTIMAHCVWPDKREMDLLAKKGVFIAHCPQSNINLSSGIAPVRCFMERGIPLGLGSDVAGGMHTSIFRAMSDAIQVSKLRQAFGSQGLVFPEDKALTLEEAFYLGTAGGGSFFGKLGQAEFGPAGSFEEGWDFDALIIGDSALGSPAGRSIRDRLARVVCLSDRQHIVGKYVRGIPVLP